MFIPGADSSLLEMSMGIFYQVMDKTLLGSRHVGHVLIAGDQPQRGVVDGRVLKEDRYP